MEIKVDLGTRKRKELAQAAGHIVGAEPTYKGPPRYAYEAGWVTVDRNGMLILPDETTHENIRSLVDGLCEQGFNAAWTDDVEVTESAPAPEKQTENSNLVIQLPLDGFTQASLENLRLLIASKALLIKKAMGICDLSIRETEETVDFPWFDTKITSDEVNAYTQFLALICDMAKRQTRVLATEKPVANEKYTFRCFLLRLGMIGEEYADTRRILLRNLSGNGSVKSGERKEPKKQAGSIPEEVEESDSLLLLEESPPKNGRFSMRRLFGGLKMMGME